MTSLIYRAEFSPPFSVVSSSSCTPMSPPPGRTKEPTPSNLPTLGTLILTPSFWPGQANREGRPPRRRVQVTGHAGQVVLCSLECSDSDSAQDLHATSDQATDLPGRDSRWKAPGLEGRGTAMPCRRPAKMQFPRIEKGRARSDFRFMVGAGLSDTERTPNETASFLLPSSAADLLGRTRGDVKTSRLSAEPAEPSRI